MNRLGRFKHSQKKTNRCHRHLANAHRTANRPKQQQVGRSLSQYIRTALEPDVGWFVGVLRAQLANNIAHPALNNRFSWWFRLCCAGTTRQHSTTYTSALTLTCWIVHLGSRNSRLFQLYAVHGVYAVYNQRGSVGVCVCVRAYCYAIHEYTQDRQYVRRHAYIDARVCLTRYTQWTGGSWNLHSHIVRICFSISPSAVRIGIVSNQNQNKKKSSRVYSGFFF